MKDVSGVVDLEEGIIPVHTLRRADRQAAEQPGRSARELDAGRPELPGVVSSSSSTTDVALMDQALDGYEIHRAITAAAEIGTWAAARSERGFYAEASRYLVIASAKRLIVALESYERQMGSR